MGSSQSQHSNKIEDSSSTNSDTEDSDEYRSVGSDMEIIENVSQLTSDAAFTTSKSTFNYPTMDEIYRLDQNLDRNDKTSIIYLLYDNPHKAYEMLLRSFDGVVTEWCRMEGHFIQKWHLKLLEALCIIKQFKALKILGYNKTEMIATFLPFNKFVCVEVNKIRKALYCIFEDLHPHEVDKFFAVLQQDLLRTNINTILDKNNLELTFLHLEKSGYFSLNNLTNLIQLFKRTDLLTQWEDFKSLQESLICTTRDRIIQPPLGATSVNWIPSNCNSSFMNDDVTQHNEFLNERRDDHHFANISEVQDKFETQQTGIRESCDTDDTYYVDPLKPGLLLIIDNEHFYTESRHELKHLLPKLTRKLDDRAGTKVDQQSLQKVFENLNFTVVVQNNVVHDKLKEHIKECIKTVEKENYSCFFVAILSHGDNGVIYGCNTIPVDIAQIQETLYVSSLAGKPKILLIQACQGENRQKIDEEYATDGIEASPLKLTSPRTSDVLVFYATIPNYTAIRHLKKGTWFIQSFCEKMALCKNHHFMDICTKVKQDVVSKRWGTVIMVPKTESSLTKNLYLTPKVTNKTKFSFNVESHC